MNTTTEGGALHLAGVGMASSSARPFQCEELSARKEELIKDAHLRAEHQAQARQTMLTLAEALNEASSRRRELEGMIVQEKEVSEQLRQELATWQPKLDRAHNEITMWRDKTVWWAVNSPVREMGLYSTLYWWVLEAIRPIAERRSTTGIPINAEESMKFDRLLLKDMFQQWAIQSPGSTLRKVTAAKHAEEVRLLKEQIVREREEAAKLLAVEKNNVKELQEKLEIKAEEAVNLQRRIRSLEEDKIQLIDKAEAAASKHKAEVEALQVELAKVPGMLEEKDRKITSLKEALKEAEDAILTAKADGEEERAALKAKIVELAGELQKSLQSAKHMKETAQKAKRETTGCISPEKFAQLIAELEETRDKMTNLGSERADERDLIDSLKLQLGQNRRRMELERQFLPLLHKVKGPVGPQNRILKGKKDGSWASKTVTVQLDQVNQPANQVRYSRSAGHLDSGLVGQEFSQEFRPNTSVQLQNSTHSMQRGSLASTGGFREARKL
eukprot:TRINITY_DN7760_c0_g1_i2.p1 TRINITY_DN7760_c0_g1~~TRINITY_DN7760_c0_g1_i2.p1  ORF type:complete len:553 (+),score=149.71 TRINITY_DN7760_c0_g1_i2:158-1660(+)